MSIKPRRKKSFKRKLIVYILLFAILGCIIFLLNSFFISKKPLFISPLGKIESDVGLVAKKLKEKNILFSQVVALPDSSYIVNILDNGQVKLSSTKDIGKQISSLQRILLELTIEGKLFKIIDFRFEEPVISF